MNEITKVYKRNRNNKVIVYTLMALFLITFCSQSSFLYPLNAWGDANCFFTIGKAMMNGRVPYRDLYDQKGPLLYFIHGVAYLISQDSFFGVYLLEVVSFATFLFWSSKIIRLFVKDVFNPVLLIMGVLILASKSFVCGDSAEEFCLPLLTISFYYSLYLMKQTNIYKHKEKIFLVNGILCGCVFWIKYTMIGFYIGWWLMVIIHFLIMREWKLLFRYLISFIGGVGISTLPWLLYFGMNGSLVTLWQVYFYNNIFLYAPAYSFGERLCAFWHELYSTFVNNKFYSIFIVIGVLNITFTKTIITSTKEKINIWAICVLTSVGIYGSGAAYKYYGFILAVFVPLGIVPIQYLIEKIKIEHHIYTLRIVSTFLAIVFCAVWIYYNSSSIWLLGRAKDQMPQYQFAEIIKQRPGASLLYYGHLDGGFYLTTNIIPDCKYFAGVNIKLDDMELVRQDYIKQGQGDFIITDQDKPPINIFDKYKEVATASTYNANKQKIDYYLYERKEDES